jgi:hypothetical protein
MTSSFSTSSSGVSPGKSWIARHIVPSGGAWDETSVRYGGPRDLIRRAPRTWTGWFRGKGVLAQRARALRSPSTRPRTEKLIALNPRERGRAWSAHSSGLLCEARKLGVHQASSRSPSRFPPHRVCGQPEWDCCTSESANLLTDPSCTGQCHVIAS